MCSFIKNYSVQNTLQLTLQTPKVGKKTQKKNFFFWGGGGEIGGLGIRKHYQTGESSK